MKYYDRNIYPELFKHAEKSILVTVITGMRRTGKTTLVKRLLEDVTNKNSLYIDLQRLDNRELFEEKNYDLILQGLASRGLDTKKKMTIVLDEIQLVPDAPSSIKYLTDSYGIKFIVTGSSSFYLKNLFSESLSGRKKIFEIYPLDFGEFLNFKEVKWKKEDWKKNSFNRNEYNRLSAYYEEYIKFGGFPQVTLTDLVKDKQDMLADIMSSYVNIDIKTLADFSNERNIYLLMKLLVSRVGSKIDYSKISRMVGVSRITVVSYIEFLEKTYLIKLIDIYSRSPDRKVAKSKKLYFCDTGLANSLSEISGGAQFENAVFNQLSRMGNLGYLSIGRDLEVDFVLDGKLALETKETPIKDDYVKTSDTSDKCGISKALLVGRNESPKFDRYVWGGSIK